MNRQTQSAMRGLFSGLSIAFSAPWPILLFVFALIMPPETSGYIGELRISPYRVVLIIMIGYCVFLMLSGRVGKIRTFDLLIALHGILVFATLSIHHGLMQGIQSGGIYFIEATGAYLLARCFIRDAASFRAMVALISCIVLGMAVFTVPESLTGTHFIREAARDAFGGPPLAIIKDRLSLTRAFGPFEHPILYGVFCATVFSLSIYVLTYRTNESWRTILRSGIIVLATAASISAGAFVALLVQLSLVIWERLTRLIAKRWLILGCLLVMAWIMVDIVSNRSPIPVALNYITFNPTTAYNRMLIWD